MMYYTLTINNNEYKLRLNAKACIDLEKKLGKNPVTVIADIAAEQTLPQLDTVLTIIHASMAQFNHGISMDKMYDLYDQYVDDGHNMYELITVIMEVFKVSGLIPENVDESSKN